MYEFGEYIVCEHEVVKVGCFVWIWVACFLFVFWVMDGFAAIIAGDTLMAVVAGVLAVFSSLLMADIVGGRLLGGGGGYDGDGDYYGGAPGDPEE